MEAGRLEVSSAQNDVFCEENSRKSSPNYLHFDDKSKLFKWKGNFNDLKEFCSKSLGIDTSVISANERSHSIKTRTATINFYLSTGTLQVQGTDKDEIKNRMASLINVSTSALLDHSEIQVSRQNVEQNGVQQEVDPFVEIREEIRKIWGVIRGQDQNSSELIGITAVNKRLREEVSLLKSNVETLKKDLRSVEDERNSLLVALKIVTKECEEMKSFHSSTASDEVNKSIVEVNAKDDQKGEEWEIVGTKKSQRKAKQRKRGKGKPEPPASLPGTSRFEESNLDDQGSPNSTRKVVILGDSMLSKLDGWKMSNREVKVKVRSFPGSTVRDLQDYIKPTLREAPQGIIVHSGTNDIPSSSPNTIVDSLVSLCTDIEKELPNTSIAISEIITRNDRQMLNTKIANVNKSLKSICTFRNWGFISHNEINTAHLNSRGLHLNGEGLGMLASSLNKYIKNKSPAKSSN